MKNKKRFEQTIEPCMLSEDIKKTFKRFGVNISIPDWDVMQDRVRYRVKIKGSTKRADVFTRAPEVQSRLQLPVFQLYVEDFIVYLLVSDRETHHPRLLKLLNDNACHKTLRKKELPYIVGHDIMGQPVVADLVTFPHLLLGGSTNSGKSVGLQALITSLIATRLPFEVNFILIDVGAGDLIAFDGTPHLSCPVVRDHDSAYRTIVALKSEMERRIAMEHTGTAEFKQLPRLVLVIDEFPALFNGGLDKNTTKNLISSLSGLLQRGRHAKIHLVLAAQNPTCLNMKIDIGNITARIAFKCAKRNFSETILGESGAENLRGSGSLLLKSPQNDGPQWIQGIYVKPKDIQWVVQGLKSHFYKHDIEQKFNLIISADSPTESSGDLSSGLSAVKVVAGPSEQDLTLASVIFWAFGQEHISTNLLMQEHHFGWNRAANLIKQLEKLGIVDELDGKRARHVRPKSIEQVPVELVEFMERCDYPPDSLVCAFQERAETRAMGKQRPGSDCCGGISNGQKD